MNCLESMSLALSINNLAGDLVSRENRYVKKGMNSIILDISHLKTGIYLVSLMDQEGGRVVKKLVVN
jgi:hypothetical protein